MRDEIPEFCSKCRNKIKEEELRASKGNGLAKEDPIAKRSMALRRAERCRYFCHHGLYRLVLDQDGVKKYFEEEPGMMGQRTCSLVVKAKCGHEVPKYNLCDQWFDGKDCPDYEERK